MYLDKLRDDELATMPYDDCGCSDGARAPRIANGRGRRVLGPKARPERSTGGSGRTPRNPPRHAAPICAQAFMRRAVTAFNGLLRSHHASKFEKGENGDSAGVAAGRVGAIPPAEEDTSLLARTLGLDG
jgi:hypothetical protein